MNRTRDRLRVGGVMVSVAALISLTFPLSAAAAPTPDVGPTVGGTAVTDPQPGVLFSSVSVGNPGGLAIGNDGNAYGWGFNLYGNVGNGSTISQAYPVKVAVADGVRFNQVDSGTYLSGALSSDGQIYAWGLNTDGGVGDGTTTTRLAPVKVATPSETSFVAVKVAAGFGMALSSGGDLYAWGSNGSGQLGDGTAISRSTPGLVIAPEDVKFTDFSVGEDFAVALGSDGLTYAWGSNSYGQLGDGTSAQRSLPASIPNAPTFAQVSASGNYAIGVTPDGDAFAWGANSDGQLGNGQTTDRSVPTAVAMPPGVTFAQIDAGFYHAIALGSDGNAYTWGLGDGGLGNGSTASRTTPGLVSMPGGVAFTSVTAGVTVSGAIASDGHTYTWGTNGSNSQSVGDGSNVNRLTPTLITGSSVISVSFGSEMATSLTQTGREWTATTPGGCGPVDVSVRYTQFGATSTQVFQDGFTYGTAATFSVQPSSGSVPEGGGTYSTSVAVDGDDAPTLQWQRSVTNAGPWQDIGGETSSTITMQADSALFIRAVASNCFGVVASDAAQVSLTTTTPTASQTPTPMPTSDHRTEAPQADAFLASTGSDVSSWSWGIGLVLLSFGAVMILLTVRARRG